MDPINDTIDDPFDDAFRPSPPLFDTPPRLSCRASVIVPARNEQDTITECLNALRFQEDRYGRPLAQDSYEVLVLVNNCTDATFQVVQDYRRIDPAFQLHVVERSFPAENAHVGTARRMLMDTAWCRLATSPLVDTAILSTDADTTVAPDWIDRNLAEVERGADAVGGVIRLKAEDLATLDAHTLRAYRADRDYQRKVARLESLLDPDPADPWPRHLEHFGASIACTPAAYSRAGGLPPIKPLEDIAFVDALRRVDARLRHAPKVCIFTSGRLDGRAEIGLSSQLRSWQQAGLEGRPQIVESAAYLAHRFSGLAQLRRLGEMPQLPSLAEYPACWRQPLLDQHPRALAPSEFLCAIDCNRLIDETFHEEREDTIEHASDELKRAIAAAARTAPPTPHTRVEVSPAPWVGEYATSGD